MWTPTKVKKYGVAVYNWPGGTRYGLPLEIGDTVQILEECFGWYRGFTTKNRSIKGIFPVSYVTLKPCRVDNEGLFESVVPVEDPVVREVTLVLREWGIIWKKLYVDRENYKFTTLRKVMRELLEWRRQLLTGTLTQDQTRELKLKVTAKIDWGNRKLGLDLVPRVGAHMVDPATMSVVELYQVHVQSSENSQGASARGTLKRKEARKVLTHHLYFCMRDFGHHVGEDSEIYFALYDTARGRYISERFLVDISKEGFSNYIEKLHSNCTIFTDLGNAELGRDIWLVAHVTRVGRMLYSDSVKKGAAHGPPAHQLFKRPHGVAVLNINEVLLNKERVEGGAAAGEEREFTFKVYQGEEKDFHQLHEFIVKKQNNKFNPLSGQPNYGIVVSLKLLHGELSQVREENPLLFKNCSLTKKLGFPDVIMPGDVRNDLYLTLDRGEFERGGKSTGKNIEVTIVVLDSQGKVLEDCLWGASGMDGTNEYQSMIIYHHNSPSWAETIRLAVPIDKFYGSHIRLEYRHCSTRDKTDNKKLFAFSFARLMESGGATLRDGQHDLHVYKCEERSRLVDPRVYLSLASGPRDAVAPTGGGATFHRSAKETVCVHTLLCSTKLTQNVDLLSLLQWKEHPERIQEALGRVLRLNGEELVKFLQDVLDALFSMFSTEDGNSTTHSGLVFHALVSIFSLLDDTKFEHFKPVMDAYIKGHFAAALVYKGLLSSVQHCADWVSSTEKQGPIQKCFRSLEYIFKFIIQSRLLFARATGGQYEDSFKRDLYNVFTALNKMLTTSYDVVLPTQVALLHSISAVYEQLVDVLPIAEVTKLATDMLESLPLRDLPPQLTQAKLAAIRNMVTGRLFADDESRNTLLLTCCKHLRCHLAHRDELRLCTEILTEVLGFLFKQRQSQAQPGKVNNCLHHDIEILCLTTLDMLIQTVLIIIDRSAVVLGCLVACLLGLLQLLDEFHYKRLWEELGERKPQKDFLLRVFLVFRDLVKMDTVFPSDWLVIKMVANNVMLGALQELAQPLVFQFLDSRSHFDNQLWSNYFNLAVAYLTQPSLQLEHFSEVKREKIVEKYGDMRVLMGFQILSMWSNLGEHKINFIPSMVGPFLEVTLVPETELRKATLFIFFDMMECEQKQRGNFKQVESELIDKLDILISENKGDDEYRQLFNTILLDRVQSEDPAWKESGSAFISSVTRLLERLLDYRSVIQGDENRDKRMSCTVNLLNFYKNEINRKEMYLRYIYKLHDLHLAADNFTEAGFTIKLYADSLGWCSQPLAADATQPSQLEWQRKEALYIKMINYFDRGKCWEQGIPLCKELAELYEKRLFDYTKLSNMLRTQAKFFDNILQQLRPEPEYFRVGFYGLSFPLFVRNKLFVYRGLEYERIGAFTQRLQMEFPSAQILMKNSPPDESIVNSDGQFIQICNVKPIPEENPLFSRPSDLPEKIASYFQVNDVRRFQLDRPIHRGPVDRDNEFKSLWIERQTLATSSSLPGILRWFEVVDRTQEDVPPVQYACETMEHVNRELRQLIAQYTADPNRNINPFSMRLQGIIDANVMGGISKYQQAFLTPEFAKMHPEFSDHIYRLKSLTLEQVHVSESGLALHGQLAPPGVQPLHRRLQERFAQLKTGLRELANSLGRPARKPHQESIVNSPLPPLPVGRSKDGADVPSNRSSASSGLGYGHLALEDEDIYTKPMEVLENLDCDGGPPPIPHRDSRPKSAGYNATVDLLARTPTRGNADYSSLPPMRSSCEGLDSGDLSPQIPRPPRQTHQRSLSKPLNLPTEGSTVATPLRNSWSEASIDEAPPLPPRGQVSDKRNTNLFLDTTPPAPPKRLVKKSSAPAIFSMDSVVDITFDSDLDTNGDLRDSGYAEFPSSSSQTPTNNFNNMSYEEFEFPHSRGQQDLNIHPPLLSPRVSNLPPPPPIPPKLVSLPATPNGTIERKQSCELVAAATENYSVPRLQPPHAAGGGESPA